MEGSLNKRRAQITDLDLFADKSSLLAEWLILQGSARNMFGVREVERELNGQLSLGRIQRLFELLNYRGLLRSEGKTTSKKYRLVKPSELLKSWLGSYNIMRKCRMWQYSCPIRDPRKIEERISETKARDFVALALHSAARAKHCSNTNLKTTELYAQGPSIIAFLEQLLELSPQARSYQVLLIQPYYKAAYSFGKRDPNLAGNELRVSRDLYHFIDLYHFPLRGREQAISLLSRNPALRTIYEGIRNE